MFFIVPDCLVQDNVRSPLTCVEFIKSVDSYLTCHQNGGIDLPGGQPGPELEKSLLTVYPDSVGEAERC